MNKSSSNGETLTASAVVIAELEGLLFTNTKERALAIATNYPSTSLGEYHGPQYLWLGSSKINYLVIPKVAPGTTIKMGVESHKPQPSATDGARGVELYIGWGNSGTKLTAPDGSSVAVPTVYEDQTWLVPENADGANDDGTYDITVYNTNGCHLYYIEVGDADQKSKIAYLYQGTPDGTQAIAENIANYEVEAIDITTTKKTAEELQDYDAVVIATNINDATYAAELKNILGWTPIVNTSYDLYDVWGLGTTVPTAPFVMIKNNHSLFNGIETIEEEEIGKGIVIESEGIYGIQDFGDYFANDEVIGTAMGDETLTTVHIHNAGHNAYIYIPAGNEQLTINAIKAAANSKAKITPAPKPVISLDYKNMNTNVTITSNVPKAQVFYTVDGSEPTESSTPYTGTFNVTTECTVKAIAKGDGYTLSEVAESIVIMKEQSAMPTISLEKAESQTTITISGEGDIWYNYANINDTTKSAKYTEPFVVRIPRTVYAFTTQEGKVNSEFAIANAEIDGFQPRIDILAHMDANSAEYNDGSTSTAYYFSWGNKKENYPYYVLDSRTEENAGTDPDTGDDIINVIYTELSPEEEKDFGNGWAVRSRGQLVIWENQSTGTNYGNTDGYNFASIDDDNPYFPTTKSYVNLADKNTTPADETFPYNAYIVTTKPFKGPFDIVINAASITKPESPGTHTIVLEVSTDGYKWENTWQTVGDTITIKESPRLTHNITRSYEGTDEVYVRAYLANNNSKVGFYDIYIANAGEKSTGISEQKAEPAKKAAGIYNLNGVRQSVLRRGLNIVVDESGKAKKVMVK